MRRSANGHDATFAADLHRRPLARIAAGLIAATSALGIVFQYPDFVVGKTSAAALKSTVDFFSMFTIETNILVCALTTAIALGQGGRIARPTVAGAACLYIAVTGLTYFVLLRPIYHPEGITLVAINLLHYAVPLAYVAFWLAFIPKGRLTLRSAATWLVFPAAFNAYTLVRGAATGWYPYPFLDVTTLGIAAVLRTTAMILIGFAVGGALIVAADRRLPSAPWMPR
jgi:hypothetical protein